MSDGTLVIEVPDTAFWRNGVFMLRVLDAGEGGWSDVQLLLALRVAMHHVNIGASKGADKWARLPCAAVKAPGSCIQEGRAEKDLCGPCLARSELALLTAERVKP